VSPEELQLYISSLERASEKNPQCSELRTCLGIAHAMNYDVYKSIDALEAAVEIDPRSFIAQYKYTELLYRLRILVRAKQEGIKAANLASNAFELAMAQKLLQEVRRLMREGSQKPEWSKPLFVPSLALVLVFVLASFLMYFKP
jgi:tetratricopeptide (TPR) repeat protein